MKEYYTQVGIKLLHSIEYLDYSYIAANIYYSFMKWITEYALRNRNVKFVIEGIWPLCFNDRPERFQNICVIIKGTSWLTSTYRAANRDQDRQEVMDKIGMGTFKNAFLRFIGYIRNNSYRVDKKDLMIKNIIKWREYFSAKSILKESAQSFNKFKVNNKDIKCIHLSSNLNLDGETFTPRVPETRMINKGLENGETPRICFTECNPFSDKSIDQALAAKIDFNYYKEFTDKKYAIYVPENNNIKKIHNKEIVDKKYVYDAFITKEMWILEPIKIKKIGEIYLTSNIKEEKEFHPFNDNNLKKTDKYRIYEWYYI